jgi:flagellar motor switch protein FliN
MSENEEAPALGPDATLREFMPLFDVPVRITVELGRLQMKVRKLMQLGPGSVIELKKIAGDPFDVCVNGLPLARCEIIVVDQTSGVRIVDVHKAGVMTL